MKPTSKRGQRDVDTFVCVHDIVLDHNRPPAVGNIMATLVPYTQRPSADCRHFDDVARWPVSDPIRGQTYL